MTNDELPTWAMILAVVVMLAIVGVTWYKVSKK